MKNICVVTGARSEYGLLRWVMQGINDSPELNLQIVATGSHLSPQFGFTYQEIENDGFAIDRKVDMLLGSDTAVGVTKSMGAGLCGFADVVADLDPDILLVVGDRYEMFIAATAAMMANIPIAHIHGGETTEGAIDESIRHSLTKMSHLHFVAAPEYWQRVIQLGEMSDRVFLVGGLGVDCIAQLSLLNRQDLEKALEFNLGKKSLLVTFHPATLEPGLAEQQIDALLAALEALEDVHFVFTMPNADVGNDILSKKINRFIASNPLIAKGFKSLGQLLYFSCVQNVSGLIGNSSSGLLEAPTFQKGAINIGDRQNGRLKASSVIDCDATSNDILSAIKKLFSNDFQRKLPGTISPYGNGGASKRIVEILEMTNPQDLLKKKFNNIGSY